MESRISKLKIFPKNKTHPTGCSKVLNMKTSCLKMKSSSLRNTEHRDSWNNFLTLNLIGINPGILQSFFKNMRKFNTYYIIDRNYQTLKLEMITTVRIVYVYLNAPNIVEIEFSSINIVQGASLLLLKCIQNSRWYLPALPYILDLFYEFIHFKIRIS